MSTVKVSKRKIKPFAIRTLDILPKDGENAPLVTLAVTYRDGEYKNVYLAVENLTSAIDVHEWAGKLVEHFNKEAKEARKKKAKAT